MGTKRTRRKESGFSLIEVLIVVVLLGIIAMIATVQVSQTLKKQRVEAAGADFKGFLDNVYLLAIQGVYRNPPAGVATDVSSNPIPGWRRVQVPIFARISARDANGERDVNIIPDLNGNRVPDDPLLDPDPNDPARCQKAFRLTSDLSFSTADPTLVGTWMSPPNASWPLVMGADGALPTLMCDISGMAFDVSAGSIQMQAPAALPITHVEMVTGGLRTRFSYVVFVSPMWQVTLQRELY